MPSVRNSVETVTGPVFADALGITLPHEHLTMEFEIPAFTPPPISGDSRVNEPLAMTNLGWIRQYPYSHKPNLRLCDAHDHVIEELKAFRAAGGSTVVDNTTIGLRRDVEWLVKASRESGVNVILGAGFYVDVTHPEYVANKSTEALAEHIRTELEDGCEGTGVRCGVIGELGCSWPLTTNEKRVLEAAALVQSGATGDSRGCPVTIHPGRNPAAPFEIVRIFQEAGGILDRTVVSHLDRTFPRNEDILEFAQLGSYCQYDLFGLETSYYQLLLSTDMPSDGERIRRIRLLIDNGFGSKVTVSHDIHTLHRLKAFGGHGFSHILENVVPMMKHRGFSREQIDALLIDNPKAWLTY